MWPWQLFTDIMQDVLIFAIGAALYVHLMRARRPHNLNVVIRPNADGIPQADVVSDEELADIHQRIREGDEG